MKYLKIILSALIAVSMFTGCEKQRDYESQAAEIFPPHDLFTVALFRMNNLNIAPAYFKEHHTTVLLGPSPCDERCQKNLDILNKVTVGQRLFVFDDLASTEHIKKLTEKYKTVSVTMGVTALSSDYFFAHFEVEGIDKANKNDYFYIVNSDGALAYSLPIKGLEANDVDNELNALNEKL